MAYDPYYDDVVLLLHGDGTNGGTTFTDNSPTPKTPSNVTGTVTSTDYKKFGTASIYKSASGELSYASGSDLIYDGTFTLEFWIYVPAFPASGKYFLSRTDNSASYFQLGADGTLTVTSTSTASFGQITQGNWHFVALVNDADNNKVITFLDGNKVSDTVAALTSTGPYAISIVNMPTISGAYVPDLYVDDLRWTKGIARYSSSFTPPTEPFPDSGTPPLSIISIVPNTGSTAGGTPVTITGTGFDPAATAAIDGNNLTDIAVIDDATITGITPAGTAGAKDVVVTNP